MKLEEIISSLKYSLSKFKNIKYYWPYLISFSFIDCLVNNPPLVKYVKGPKFFLYFIPTFLLYSYITYEKVEGEEKDKLMQISLMGWAEDILFYLFQYIYLKEIQIFNWVENYDPLYNILGIKSISNFYESLKLGGFSIPLLWIAIPLFFITFYMIDYFKNKDEIKFI